MSFELSRIPGETEKDRSLNNCLFQPRMEHAEIAAVCLCNCHEFSGKIEKDRSMNDCLFQPHMGHTEVPGVCLLNCHEFLGKIVWGALDVGQCGALKAGGSNYRG